MKWRKQMTAMWDDERVARLVKAGGVEGLAAFGLYCRVLDIVASQMDGKTASCSVTYDVSRWSLLLSLRGSHVRHWLEKLAVTTLLTVEWMDSEAKVTIPKLLKYRDEYSSKSGQTPHKEQNRTDTEQINTPAPEVSTARVALEEIRQASPKAGSAKERGSRLSIEELPAEWLSYAEKEYKWAPDRTAKIFSNFRDYWLGVPGAKGRKVDWFATWRNRCGQVDEATSGRIFTGANGSNGYIKPEIGGYKPGKEIRVERPVD